MYKQEIHKQSKQILEKFAKALEKVETKEEDLYVERDNFERDEGEGKAGNEDFKKRILENAPNKDDDFIIAEKKEWK